MASAWRGGVMAMIGGDAGTPHWVSLGGSSLHELWRVDVAGASYFVKANVASKLPMLQAEADGLRELAQAKAIRVPVPAACGKAHGISFLALEWLDLVSGGRDATLGRALAQLHKTTSDQFGWYRDNTIGTTPQSNAWCGDWAEFFRDCRIAPQLRLARRHGHRTLNLAGDLLLERVPAMLDGHTPMPSLVHGDLWSGNAARLARGEPVIFDPACYFGDRETDIAMAELFGGFDDSFFAAYHELWPADAGYPVRRTLYNLYHVLNHLNLFGAGYLARAEAMIGELIAEVR
ncbi:MAG: fructosamine kinase family protein [Betaproteobacteria bacterium]